MQDAASFAFGPVGFAVLGLNILDIPQKRELDLALGVGPQAQFIGQVIVFGGIGYVREDDQVARLYGLVDENGLADRWAGKSEESQ